MKVLFKIILFLIIISCQNSNSKANNQSFRKIENNTMSFANEDETINDFLQRAKKAALSDDELQKIIEFPLLVRGLDENLVVFEDNFNSFSEIKDNIMLYEAVLKSGLSSAISISKGNCDFFDDNKNCFIINTTEIGDIEVVLLKKNNQYKVVAIEILTT